MKKCLQLICAGFVVLCFCVSVSLSSVFPVDSQPYVEKKYAGWNGVLQAWIYSDWNPDGSFIRWLNSCAAKFEKDHDGIFLEFIPVQEALLKDMDTSGIRMPDLVFFSPGVITNQDILTRLESKAAIRRELKNYGNGKALPVAMSGYIWAYDTSLIEGAPQNPGDLSVLVSPEDIPAATLIGLLSGSSSESPEEMVFPDSDIDLGLPASVGSNPLYSADAIDRFIDGKIPCVPVDSNTLAQLNRLKEKGKGPTWTTAVSGELACTDRILLAAIPVQNENPERTVLAEEFISLLLERNSQDALADIGAFSVNGERIHSDFSVYGEMDAMLNHLPLWLPDCFSEYSFSNSEAIVRGFLKGEISAKNALSLLGFEGM